MNKEYEEQTGTRIVKDEIDYEKIEITSERHEVPFGSLAVTAFSDEGLRNTVADFWEPKHCCGDEQSKLWDLLYNVRSRGSCRASGRESEFKDHLIAVRILLIYPLEKCWEAIITLPADRFGIVFSITHDMYRHIYKLDDAIWKTDGKEEIPRLAPKCMNRAHGKYVWGHDIEDLVFEWIYFKAADDAKPIKKEDKPSGIDSIPLLGTVTFAIGS